jgi:hypothetical protein
MGRVSVVLEFVIAISGLLPPLPGAVQKRGATASAGEIACPEPCVTVITCGDPRTPVVLDFTSTVPVLVRPLVFSSAVMVNVPGVVPSGDVTLNHERDSDTVYSMVPEEDGLLFVTEIGGEVPPALSTFHCERDTERTGSAALPVCVTVNSNGEPTTVWPVIEIATVADRESLPVLSSAVIVKPPGVVPPVAESVSHEATSSTVYEYDLPGTVTETYGDSPPAAGAVQEAGETMSESLPEAAAG